MVSVHDIYKIADFGVISVTGSEAEPCQSQKWRGVESRISDMCLHYTG